MVLLIIGLAILLIGGWVYGLFCERMFGPDDRKTPAYAKGDGVDFVPMKSWKNTLINLVNIAGTDLSWGPSRESSSGPSR